MNMMKLVELRLHQCVWTLSARYKSSLIFMLNIAFNLELRYFWDKLYLF